MTTNRSHIAGIPAKEIRIGDRVTVGYMAENRSAIVISISRDSLATSDGGAHWAVRDSQIEVYSRNNPIPQQ